jgi:hypothetical protein
MITGEQRLRNVMTKVRILASRDLKAYLANKLDVLPGWRTDEMIAREFERLTAGDPHTTSTRRT